MSNFNGAQFLAAVANVAHMARVNGWHYGNSIATPPCSDGLISCDRLQSRALWDLGVTDQPAGGWVTAQLAVELPQLGFTETTDRGLIVPGTVCIVGLGSDQTYHCFTIASYDPDTDTCSKYDMGEQWRIESVQPFTNVPLVQWADRYLYKLYLPPAGGKFKPWMYAKHFGWRMDNNGCSCILSRR